MAVSTWLALRQAREAVADGRPDDAHRLLAPLLDEGYRKAVRMTRDVAQAYAARAARFLDRDNADAAWRDLLAAEALNTGEKAVADLRQTLTRLGFVQARGALEAGNPVAAVEAVSHLRERGVRNPDLPRIEEAAQDWILAAEKADRGDFLQALGDLDLVRRKIPCPPTGLDRYRANVEARHERFREAVGRAHEAAEARRWREALAAADEALAVAPEYREARTLRTRAWQAAYPETGIYQAPRVSAEADRVGASTAWAVRAEERAEAPEPPTRSDGPWRMNARESGSGRGPLDEGYRVPTTRLAPVNSPSGSDRATIPKRFLLWVDGVGAYLVCTSTRVTFGQAALEGGPVDIPLFADVSRIHAELSRDGEGYLVEAGKAAPVNGKETPRTVLLNGRDVARSVLAPGDRVTLGLTCQFLFQQPVPASATARLDLTSGHRLNHPVDGVLLMANELILGPGPDAHIVVGDATERVMIYRSKDGLGVRYTGREFRVDDRPCCGAVPLVCPASVVVDSFSFAVEPVGPRI